jgi:hypothetical protein
MLALQMRFGFAGSIITSEGRNDSHSFAIEPLFPFRPWCGSWVFASVDAPLGGALEDYGERLRLRLSL